MDEQTSSSAGEGSAPVAITLGEDDFVARPRPWLTLLCAAAAGAAFVTAQGIVFLFYMAAANQAERPTGPFDKWMDRWFEENLVNGKILSMTAVAGAVASVPLMIAFGRMLGEGRMDKTLGLKRTSVRNVLGWTAAVFATALAIDNATNYLGGEVTSPFMTHVYETASPKWLLWVALCVAAPLAEEFLFRGLLYGGLVETWLGFWGMALLTSVSWAALHIQYEIGVMVMIAALGIMLAMARRTTGSIYPCLAMHAAMNAWATFQTAYIR